MEKGRVFVDGVTIQERMRAVDDTKVGEIAESMEEIGLQHPISVYETPDHEVQLLSGLHRLRAAEYLGWSEIDCVFVNLDEPHRELIEIDENLCRQELSPAEYSAHVARRKELYEALYGTAEENRAQTAAEARWHGDAQRQVVGKHPDPFTADTAAKTGKSERTVQRAAERGENVADDVRQRIQGTKLDKGTYLDALAKLSPEEQRGKVEADLAEPAPAKRGTTAGQDEAEKSDQRERKRQAADQIANLLAEHIPGEHWAALKANLRTVSGKEIAEAFERETGVAVFDQNREL